MHKSKPAVPTTRAQWLRDRRQGVGGSEIGAIMGVSPWRTILDVYVDKTTEGVAEEPNNAMRRGIALEDTVADMVADMHPDWDLVKVTTIHHHPVDTHLLANPDRIVLCKERGRGVLEIKCPGVWAYDKMKRDGVDDSYVLQLQHYLHVCDAQWGAFAIFSAEKWENPLIVMVERDDLVIDRLRDAAHNFWFNHVIPKIPPVMTLPPSPLPAKEFSGTLVHLPDEATAQVVLQAASARDVRDDAEALYKQGIVELKALLPAKGAYRIGAYTVHWTEVARAGGLDQKALQAAHPDVDLTKFQKPNQFYDTLKIFSPKEQ